MGENELRRHRRDYYSIPVEERKLMLKVGLVLNLPADVFDIDMIFPVKMIDAKKLKNNDWRVRYAFLDMDDDEGVGMKTKVLGLPEKPIPKTAVVLHNPRFLKDGRIHARWIGVLINCKIKNGVLIARLLYTLSIPMFGWVIFLRKKKVGVWKGKEVIEVPVDLTKKEAYILKDYIEGYRRRLPIKWRIRVEIDDEF